MLNIVLYQPEIPPNTGNVIRLCANNGFTLHLIHPLGFSLEEKAVRRAGLDYHELATVRQWESIEHFYSNDGLPQKLYAFSTRSSRCYSEAAFSTGDYLMFGPETRGLPDEVLLRLPAQQRLRIPMKLHSRSLNLSNAVAIAAYEAWRQTGFS